MGLRSFDRKFGADFLDGVPTGPGIYLFRDAANEVLYVGKASNLRRRLQRYRSASRRQVDRKMRALVRAASTLEVQERDTERDALLAENALIRELRPPFNVDGVFTFLYPAIGVGQADGHALLCFTTKPDEFSGLDLRWFGAFRSRSRAREAFDTLVELLSFIGHASTRAQLPPHPAIRGSRLVGLRQLPRELVERLPPFLGGENRGLLPELAEALLAKPRALREAPQVQQRLRRLARFYEADTRRLRLALDHAGREGTFVSQHERDALFISDRFDGSRR